MLHGLVCAGSGGAAAGPERGHGAAGEEQDAALHPVHAARHRQLPERQQRESQTTCLTEGDEVQDISVIGSSVDGKPIPE